jgi:hypothetical protein
MMNFDTLSENVGQIVRQFDFRMLNETIEDEMSQWHTEDHELTLSGSNGKYELCCLNTDTGYIPFIIPLGFADKRRLTTLLTLIFESMPKLEEA